MASNRERSHFMNTREFVADKVDHQRRCCMEAGRAYEVTVGIPSLRVGTIRMGGLWLLFVIVGIMVSVQIGWGQIAPLQAHAEVASDCVKPQLIALDDQVPIYDLTHHPPLIIAHWEVGTAVTIITERTISGNQYFFVQKIGRSSGGWVSGAVVDCADQPTDYIESSQICTGTERGATHPCHLEDGNPSVYWLHVTSARIERGDLLKIVVLDPNGNPCRTMTSEWQSNLRSTALIAILTNDEISQGGHWVVQLWVNDHFAGLVPFKI
jgi:hypothetical protein